MSRGLILRLVIYGGLLIMAWFWFSHYARRMTYPIPAGQVLKPAEVDEVALTAVSGERLIAWLHADADDPPDLPVLIFFHGNAQDLDSLWESGLMRRFRGLGVRVLAIDYPGYGPSEGRPHEDGLVESGRLALAWVRARFPEAPVALAGWSLGAAVAVQTARDGEAAGLILLSPWSSLPDVAAAHFPRWLIRLFVRERYDSLAAAPGIETPALVVHGEDDAIIPAAQGAALAQALPQSRWRPIPDYGHNDLMLSEDVWRELAEFLTTLP